MHNYVWLHVESTTRCNAWCPFCPRNNNGFGIASDLIIQDLDLTIFKNVLDSNNKLETIQFCGNLGDPLAAKNFDEQLDLVLSYQNVKKIQIHTNGSLRNKEWWMSLYEKTKNIKLDVWFAIDGHKDNHSLYRQGTDYDKIIENAKTFINCGGSAVWQFILFEHNKNDVVSCYQLSQQLNFKQFKLIKNSASDKKSYHYQTGKELNIKSVKDQSKVDMIHEKSSIAVRKENCMHLSYPSMYLMANGEIKPCCYLGSSNLNYQDIKKSFITKQFFKECVTFCGTKIKP